MLFYFTKCLIFLLQVSEVILYLISTIINFASKWWELDWYISVMQALGEMVKVRQQVIATATIYFKRFYARWDSTNHIAAFLVVDKKFDTFSFQFIHFKGVSVLDYVVNIIYSYIHTKVYKDIIIWFQKFAGQYWPIVDGSYVCISGIKSRGMYT